MQYLNYSCETIKLHPHLQTVWEEQEYSIEAEAFKNKKSSLYGIKFIFFVFMSAFGIKHYNIMGMLWYETYLLSEKNIQNMLGKKKRKKLLDIGAWNGCVTEQFSSHVDKIYYIEPSLSFQKILNKKWYRQHQENTENTYDIVTLFNVLDVCDSPDKTIQWALKHLEQNGEIIMSLPFPIKARSWDNKKITQTNLLTQKREKSFEAAVSDFYGDFIKKNDLKVKYFTRLPYIVSLPETQKTTVYDNGLFVCSRA